MNVLFVCSGNISRSYLAEALFREKLRKSRLTGVGIRSAGIRAFPGNAPDPEMVRFLRERGLPADGHRARALSEEDVSWADRILVMERAHLLVTAREFPAVRDKAELLSRYIPGSSEPEDIEDPFGLSPRHYGVAQARISKAVEGLLAHLEGLGGKG